MIWYYDYDNGKKKMIRIYIIIQYNTKTRQKDETGIRAEKTEEREKGEGEGDRPWDSKRYDNGISQGQKRTRWKAEKKFNGSDVRYNIV
jgi:hypothetical protein